MKEKSVLFMATLVFVLFMPTVIKAVEETENIAHLKKLGRACLVYMEVHDNKVPPSLSTLYYEGYISDVKSFASPANPEGVLERVYIDGQSDYVLSHRTHRLGGASKSTGAEKELSSSKKNVTRHISSAPRIDPSGPAKPIIQDRSADNNDGKKVYVFYSDGSIRLESGEVVLVERQTIEPQKPEKPKAGLGIMERPTKERPTMEKPESEKSVMERSTLEIPVAERSEPEKPVPDKQSFEEYKKEQLDEFEKWLEQKKGSQ